PDSLGSWFNGNAVVYLLGLTRNASDRHVGISLLFFRLLCRHASDYAMSEDRFPGEHLSI
ncbi:MAG: hypothetical protein AB1664_15050, partial [Thermodesulfobacteriota bacterium]